MPRRCNSISERLSYQVRLRMCSHPHSPFSPYMRYLLLMVSSWALSQFIPTSSCNSPQPTHSVIRRHRRRRTLKITEEPNNMPVPISIIYLCPQAISTYSYPSRITAHAPTPQPPPSSLYYPRLAAHHTSIQTRSTLCTSLTYFSYRHTSRHCTHQFCPCFQINSTLSACSTHQLNF